MVTGILSIWLTMFYRIVEKEESYCLTLAAQIDSRYIHHWSQIDAIITVQVMMIILSG